MHPFWNHVVEWCPKWIAPNLLTFAGFLFTVLNFLLLSYYDYNFYASSDEHPEFPAVPQWVWAVAALNIFLAYTLDGIDGKQARRTQTTGPLGELFDHGLDSWTAFLIPTCMYSVFGRSMNGIPPLRMYFCLWNIFVNFYLSHWEKHITGVLFLPWGYDASMVVAILIFVITSVFGRQVWEFSLPGGISSGHMFELTFYICAMASNIPMSLWNIYKSYRDRTGKMRPFSEAVKPLVPVTLFLIVCTVWVVYSPVDIVNLDPRCVYLVTGTIFSNICCRLIVSQMSSVHCDLFNWLIIPVGLVTAVSLMLPSTTGASAELSMLYALAVITTVAHVHYGTCVVRQMCRHFRISCFRNHQHRE
ncbi:ethanolaminephosphotransferase 1 isoform X2 [Cryptotermes secundus]|nr:ethanolaminephosphotransferase 1 isoform X2 [Cryptotermes secundus]